MHFQNDHFINIKPQILRERRRDLIINNMSILTRCRTPKEYKMTEAIYIKDRHSNFNIQSTRLRGILKLFPLIVD